MFKPNDKVILVDPKGWDNLNPNQIYTVVDQLEFNKETEIPLAAVQVYPDVFQLVSSIQQDTVIVPRDILERTIDRLTHGHELEKANRELRALLAGGGA